jgi:hypothetical protein
VPSRAFQRTVHAIIIIIMLPIKPVHAMVVQHAHPIQPPPCMITLHYITCSTHPGVVNPIQEPTRGSLGDYNPHIMPITCSDCMAYTLHSSCTALRRRLNQTYCLRVQLVMPPSLWRQVPIPPTITFDTPSSASSSYYQFTCDASDDVHKLAAIIACCHYSTAKPTCCCCMPLCKIV